MKAAENWDEHLRVLEAAEGAVAAARRVRGEAKENFDRAGAGLRHHVIALDRGDPRPSPYYEDKPSQDPRFPTVRLPPHGPRVYEASPLSHLFDAGIPKQPETNEEFLPPLERQLSGLSSVINTPGRDAATIARAEAWRERLECVRDTFQEARDALAEADEALAAVEAELEKLQENAPRSSQQALSQLAKRADEIGEDLERGREKCEAAEVELQDLQKQRAGLALGDLAARAALATGKDQAPAEAALAEAEATDAKLRARIERQQALVDGLSRWLTETEAKHQATQLAYRAAAFQARERAMQEAEQTLAALLSESGVVAEAVAKLNSSRTAVNAVAPEGQSFPTATLKIEAPILYGPQELERRIEFR